MTKASYKKFIWAHGSRETNVCHGKGGMAASDRQGCRNRKLRARAQSRESKLDGGALSNVKITTTVMYFLTIPLLLNPPKQHHQLGSKYSNAWGYRRHLIQTTTVLECLHAPIVCTGPGFNSQPRRECEKRRGKREDRGEKEEREGKWGKTGNLRGRGEEWEKGNNQFVF